MLTTTSGYSTSRAVCQTAENTNLNLAVAKTPNGASLIVVDAMMAAASSSLKREKLLYGSLSSASVAVRKAARSGPTTFAQSSSADMGVAESAFH